MNEILYEFDNIDLITWNNIEYENNFIINNISIYLSNYIFPYISYKTIKTSIFYDINMSLTKKYIYYFFDIDYIYISKIIELFDSFYFKLNKIIIDIDDIEKDINEKEIIISNSIEYFSTQIVFLFKLRGKFNHINKFNTFLYIQIYILYIINNKSYKLYLEIKTIIHDIQFNQQKRDNKFSFLYELINSLKENEIIELKNIIDKINLNEKYILINEYILYLDIYKLFLNCYDSHLLKTEEKQLIFIYYLCRNIYDIEYHKKIGKTTIITKLLNNKKNLERFILRIFSYISIIDNQILKNNMNILLLYGCCINKKYLYEKRYNFIIQKYLYDFKNIDIKNIRNNFSKFIL